MEPCDTTRVIDTEPLLRSRTEVAVLLDLLPTYAWASLDPECRVVIGNRFAEALVGPGNIFLPPAQPGEAAPVRLLKEDGCSFRPEELPLQRAVALREPVRDCYLRFVFPDGRAIATQACATPLFDATGALSGAVAVFLDLARREAEEQLIQAEKMASIGRLAGGIAHNFNNQLAAVLGFAELLLEKLDDPLLRDYARNILTSARRSADLTTQLLAFARKGKYRSQSMGIHALVGETVSLMQQSVDRRIEILQHLDAAQDTILGDPTQLKNVLLSLGLNARDALPRGGRILFTTATRELAGDPARELGVSPGLYLELAVTDTGVGMSEDVRQRIFEPFFTTKDVGKGTGLSLSATLGVITNHGGAIRAQSTSGKGSTFTIWLPLLKRKPLPQAGPGAASPGSDGRGKGCVLMVDDEGLVLDLGTELLRGAGYHVETCLDGGAAVAFYREHWQRIDLVILDVVMPNLGGRDTYAALRAINPRLRVLVTSGYNPDDMVEDILHDGAQGFLQKPFNRAEILHRVSMILDASQPRA